MDFRPSTTYCLELDTTELRVVVKALGGRLKDEDGSMEDTRGLLLRIVELKAKIAENHAKQSRKLADNVLAGEG